MLPAECPDTPYDLAGFRWRVPFNRDILARWRKLPGPEGIRMNISVGKSRVSIIDPEDYALVRAITWTVSNGYARASRRETSTQVYMHRLIMAPGPRKVIDHINHDTLDNRRCNLRVCDRCENVAHQHIHAGKKTSRFKGVALDKSRGKWVAQITKNYQNYHLGRFDSEMDAARAYNNAAVVMFGDFAIINEV